MGSIGLALIAGVLSTLSPCVLPLVPIVVATALGEHRLGPVALAAGLASSFVIIGLFVATVGFGMRDTFAQVFDDARAFFDRYGSAHSSSVNR